MFALQAAERVSFLRGAKCWLLKGLLIKSGHILDGGPLWFLLLFITELHIVMVVIHCGGGYTLWWW